MTFEELAAKASTWWQETRNVNEPAMVDYLRSRGVTNPEELEEQEDRVGLGAGIVIGLYLAEHPTDFSSGDVHDEA